MQGTFRDPFFLLLSEHFVGLSNPKYLNTLPLHYHYTLYVKRFSSLTITISVSCCMCILCHRPGFRLCPGWWGSRCPLLVVLGGSASSSQARPGAASHLAGHNNTTHPWAAAYTVHSRYLDICIFSK